MTIFGGKMPNITQAQIIAALTWVAAQAVSAGWVDDNTSQKWLSIGSSIISGVWILGDAILRAHRVNALAKMPPETAAKLLGK